MVEIDRSFTRRVLEDLVEIDSVNPAFPGPMALPAGVPFWTDAAFVRATGADTVVYGPAGAGAHADEEWVDLASVYDCAAVFARVALSYCSTPSETAPASGDGTGGSAG